MPDTLRPATLNETIVAGDTYEGTRDYLEGNTVATATAPDLTTRTYEMVVQDDTGAELARISEVSNAQGVITRNADSTTGRLRWRIEGTVTALWPVGDCKLRRWLTETRISDGTVQTLFVGEINVLEAPA